MVDLLKHVIEIHKLPTEVKFGVLGFCALVLGILLWVPDDLLKAMGLIGFREDYKSWLGLGFLFFGVLLLMQGIAMGLGALKNGIRKRRFFRDGRKRLGELTGAKTTLAPSHLPTSAGVSKVAKANLPNSDSSLTRSDLAAGSVSTPGTCGQRSNSAS